jgi:hypothetical protein
MRRTILVALAALAAAPASGQQQVTPPAGIEGPVPPPPPPGGMSVSGQGRIVISSDLCASLGGVPAVPGADYRPGVDVNGDAVAPADLPRATPPPALENFPIEVGANLQKRHGIAANSTLLHGNPVVGLVTLHDGRMYFNGAPISDNERDMILAACREAKR